MNSDRILLLGCGYTARRAARGLLALGHELIATARDLSTLTRCGSVALQVDIFNPRTLEQLAPWVTPSTSVLYSLPTIGETDLTPSIIPYIQRACRVVYLSTTGVYGAQLDVNATSSPGPRTDREKLRVSAEEALAANFPNLLILRPAAIYGPYRGIHTALRAGTYRLPSNGTNYVSRIHVDDLAAHCVAGLRTEHLGAWPVADERPCTSGEITSFCAQLLGLPLPAIASTEQLPETRRADRRVDGSAIRGLLGIRLRYPDYRVGIPACIAAEASDDAVERAL